MAGWGFATPWVPWDPAFDGWIIDHSRRVMQAHNMWVDVYAARDHRRLPDGLIYLRCDWRSWFFAVDRPRWDLREDRPYSPLSLLPTLTMAILLVAGPRRVVAPSRLGLAVRRHVRLQDQAVAPYGEGPAEQSVAIERGELTKRVP